MNNNPENDTNSCSLHNYAPLLLKNCCSASKQVKIL
uniref:Uncharacterized protein n=1 Tax=Arundo donax TaxID=35708 RepID=A0A0A9B4V2_ARUDO